MNSYRSFCLLIVLTISAGICSAQTPPCQAGKLEDMIGKQCMLGNLIFSPFAVYGELPDPDRIFFFQPDATHPNNPGFTISRYPYPPPLLSTDSKFDPSFPGFPNEVTVSFGYRAVLPCTGTICETILAPVITAVTAIATDYSIDLGGFPAGFGSGLSSVVHQAYGSARTCSSGELASVTATAGEQLYNDSPANDITWGPSNSAAFPCVQRAIEGVVTAIVEVNECATCDTLSTVSLGSASFYIQTGTIQAFSNGDTGGGASQPLPRILPAAVAFSAFSNKLQATSSGFELVSSFTLGGTSAGINPLAEPLTLQVGRYAVTVPAQSLHMTTKGVYVYQGIINGESLQLQIVPGSAATYTLKAELGVSTTVVLESSVLVALTIGNDFGAAQTATNN